MGHIVVYVDHSTSISDQTLMHIRTAVIELSQNIDFVVYPFTGRIHEEKKEIIANGYAPQMQKRVTGGTSFTSIVKHVQELSDKPSTYIICTDGESIIPDHCHIPRYWILFHSQSNSHIVNHLILILYNHFYILCSVELIN